jgi:hypothetical protein
VPEVTGCSPGYANCSGNPSTGCATSITTVQNCGGCGILCPSGPNSTPICSGGACTIACAAGYADCDGIATNGCEVDLLTDAAHCGSCANACDGGACVAGVCTGG